MSSVSPFASGGVSGVNDDPTQDSGSGIDPQGVDSGKKEKVDNPEEEKLVRRWWRKYEAARDFDEDFRKQIAVDRRYAAGTSDPSWAVTTNLIGAYIDILVSLLYARNPDVSVRKAPQVDEAGSDQSPVAKDFPRTLELVISYLWKKGKLKPSARKGVRSILSTGEGWLKCMMVAEADPNALPAQTVMNDTKEMQLRLAAIRQQLASSESSPDDEEALKAEAYSLMASIESHLELAIQKMFVIDFVPTENMQVSTDVQSISDHLDANWNSNEKFVEWETALATFPRLDEDDLKTAKAYYQKKGKESLTQDRDTPYPQGAVTAEVAAAFTSGTPSKDNQAKFVRVVELWHRVDRMIYTIIEGVKVWPREPYAPPYPTSRFYPYFFVSFYEVDGERHPQSLAWRLYKLQDEYSSVRSNYRLLRERSIPAILFDSTAIDALEAKKITDAKLQELIALRPSNPNKTLAEIFAPKPVAPVDPRLFDVSMILADMERISGVQEALSAAQTQGGNPKTATEAQIQQTGTNARTSSDRDNEEIMLGDLAEYTAEQSLQCFTNEDAVRIAGPKALWPAGMSIQDLFTLVSVDITAGSTGKPRQGADQQAWVQFLPILQTYIQQINQALALGDIPLATALQEVVKETMLRMGDESDPERFLPQVPPPGSPGSNPPPKPVPVPVTASLRGEITDPMLIAQLLQPDLTQDALAASAARAAAAQAAGQAPPGGPPGAGPGQPTGQSGAGGTPPMPSRATAPAPPGPAHAGPGATP